MAPLRNARHEKFTQALFAGKSAHQAYIDAGYKPCRQNAARLTTSDDVRARLTELQEAVAEANEVSVASLLGELEEHGRASNLDQLSAAVRAIEAKAKVSGIMVQRVEIGHPGEFNDCKTLDETVDRLIEIEAPGVNFTAEDKAKMRGLLEAMSELLSSRKPELPRHHSQRQIELSRGNGYKRIGHR